MREGKFSDMIREIFEVLYLDRLVDKAGDVFITLGRRICPDWTACSITYLNKSALHNMCSN